MHTGTNCISIHANVNRVPTKATVEEYHMNTVYIELTAAALVVWFDVLFTYLEMPAESTMHYKIVMPPRTQSGTKKYNWNYLQKNDYGDVDQASLFEMLIIESAAAVADGMSYEEKKRTTAPTRSNSCTCMCEFIRVCVLVFMNMEQRTTEKTQTLT